MTPRNLGILAILIVLLAGGWFAFQATQKKRGGAAASARNLQQWGIALNLYLIDNDSQLPEPGATPITADETQAWYNALPLYLRLTPLADLPAGRRPKPGDGSPWTDPTIKAPRIWDPEVFYFNYAMNAFLQPADSVRSFRIFEIENPGNVIFLSEVDGYDPALTPDRVVFRHGGGRMAHAQVLFCDGHVAPVVKAVLVDDPKTLEAAAAASGPSWYAE